MKEFGIRFDGIEEPLEKILSNHIKDKDKYVFLEVGTASMKTHRAICDIIRENIKSNDYLTIGLDINGSLDVNFIHINKYFHNNELTVNRDENDINCLDNIKTNSILELRNDPRAWIKNIKDNSLDLCLIDGCHGKSCVMADFLAIENKIKSGGIIMLHDVGLAESGTDWQGHCNEYINVRNALIELNLLENTTRNGWLLIEEIAGTRKLNNDINGGNSLVLFKKI